MRIDFHPEATAELDASTDWYAEHGAAAARNFLVAVDIAITSITQDPVRFFRVDERHQACSVVKFPFQIVYRHESNRIVIIAIAHAKRRPGYWRDRKFADRLT